MTTIYPLHDNVIVRRAEEQTETAGGIILPGDTTEEKPAEGKVIAVGKGKTLSNGEVDALDVKVGDRIIFGQKAGEDITINSEEFLVIIEDEIIAILR